MILQVVSMGKGKGVQSNTIKENCEMTFVDDTPAEKTGIDKS